VKFTECSHTHPQQKESDPNESVMSKFRERDIRRAIKAVEKAGKQVACVEIDADGKIIVIVGKPDESNNRDATNNGANNEWDRI
jgi:hypothetical protein